jgi:hypothetical protein
VRSGVLQMLGIIRLSQSNFFASNNLYAALP